MKPFVTKAQARQMLQEHKAETNFFNGCISEVAFYDMLRYNMGFGMHEAETVIAALVLAGAKFRKDNMLGDSDTTEQLHSWAKDNGYDEEGKGV